MKCSSKSVGLYPVSYFISGGSNDRIVSNSSGFKSCFSSFGSKEPCGNACSTSVISAGDWYGDVSITLCSGDITCSTPCLSVKNVFGLDWPIRCVLALLRGGIRRFGLGVGG